MTLDGVSPRMIRSGAWFWIVLAFLLLISARAFASYALDVAWWGELQQQRTFYTLLFYRYLLPLTLAVPLTIVLWVVHARGMKQAGTGLRQQPEYARLVTLLLLLASVLLSYILVDGETLLRFQGSRTLSAASQTYRDPVFGQGLSFYFFALPLYRMVLRIIVIASVISAVVYWLTVRFWQARQQWQFRGEMGQPAFDFDLRSMLEPGLLRKLAALLLLAFAVSFYLDRYDLLFADHGLWTGIDYVDERVRLPLLWVSIAAAVAGAMLALVGRWKLALVAAALIFLPGIVPPIVSSVYVRPNEITLQKPYIERHIAATRQAYKLGESLREVDFAATLDASIDVQQARPLLSNVRLWDWQAFHDTVTQIQALRPYYVFFDSDVDRYMIDGQLQQVLLTPRELDVDQLGDARARWVNPRFIYTHGYGLVLAEANRITPDGLPVMLVQDAPPTVKSASLKLTRPEVYYGEVTHEPVFVRTSQEEFNYPAGSGNVQTSYGGQGGFVIGPALRLAAALQYGEPNILLTGFLRSDSRMMIHRGVRERLDHLADFIEWDTDPYLVLTDEGRLVWIVDGYTHASRFPYARHLNTRFGEVNYVRNSVKATIDAYDGTTKLWVFDAQDPLLQAYRGVLPDLFQDAAQMPANLRAHTRAPETLFRVQAEIYRTFHVQDPESFYNREDAWDLARSIGTESEQQDRSGTQARPTYVIATLPGETKPEFLLLLPFTPRNKDNLIGLMAARCDGEHLGEIVVLRLTKQALLYGPMQIEARINQDETISKDLTLWNQQGSQVLRGQMLVLPVGNSFVYVEPIYIQSRQSRMPQLKKVVLAKGNDLFYEDTYDQVLARLEGTSGAVTASLSPPAASEQLGSQRTSRNQPVAPVTSSPAATSDPRVLSIRGHLQRYRELASQGRWAEAGRELEALEREVNR